MTVDTIEAVVEALAEVHHSTMKTHSRPYPTRQMCPGPEHHYQEVREQLTALTPEVRDKLLLGFALAELGYAELHGPYSKAPPSERWSLVFPDPEEPWNRHFFRGPTPLAAVLVALRWRIVR